MSNVVSLSMATSVIIEATGGPAQSVLTVPETASPTPPIAIYTSGSLTGHLPEYTGPATPTSPIAIYTSASLTGRLPEYTGPANTPGSSSNGLSVGAKAGVGVGVVVGVLVLAALLWLAYAMGKRRARAAPSYPPQYDSVVHGEGKQSKATLDSVDSSIFEEVSAIEQAHITKKSHASSAKI